MNASLKLHQRKPVEVPDRGPLLSARQVFERFFRSAFPSIKDPGRWVKRVLPDELRVSLGRQTGYYLNDVEQHLESIRGK